MNILNQNMLSEIFVLKLECTFLYHLHVHIDAPEDGCELHPKHVERKKCNKSLNKCIKLVLIISKYI